MKNEILDIIESTIVKNSDVDFMGYLLAFNPISFIKDDTREILNVRLNPANETQFEDLNFISKLTATIVSNEKYNSYIKEFINIYLQSIKDLAGPFSILFYTPKDYKIVLENDNRIYMILLFIILNYNRKIKIHKDK